MEARAPGLWMPALIGGGAFGVASAIPFVGALNCLCCSLIIGSGLVAAVLYSKQCRDANVAFRAGQGALVGLVAGLVYGVVGTVVGAVVQVALPPIGEEWLIEILEDIPSIPPEVIDQIRDAMEQGLSAAALVFGLFMQLLLGAVFGTLGGLIGGAAFKVEPAPPAPPTQ